MGAHDDDLRRARLSAGDPAAFTELVRLHGAGVRGLLRRMGAQPALADDIAQDAFLAAYERIGNFRGEGSFGGWVGRIGARLYIRRLRGRLSLEQPLDEHAEESWGGEGEAISRIDLDEALNALSPAERLCVSMCHGAGFSHAEVAKSLNTPLGTVKSHVKRGLDKLRLRLGPDAGREDGQ